jgi:hypothetical protein
MAYNTPKELVIISSTTINLKATGNTIIFTPNTKFVVTAINAYGVNLSGTIGVPAANFGWTAAAYSDLTAGFITFATVTNNVTGVDIQTTLGETQPIPAATAFRINVTAADATATTNSQRIDILGYYL